VSGTFLLSTATNKGSQPWYCNIKSRGLPAEPFHRCLPMLGSLSASGYVQEFSQNQARKSSGLFDLITLWITFPRGLCLISVPMGCRSCTCTGLIRDRLSIGEACHMESLEYIFPSYGLHSNTLEAWWNGWEPLERVQWRSLDSYTVGNSPMPQARKVWKLFPNCT
jgi:hypothetical protein